MITRTRDFIAVTCLLLGLSIFTANSHGSSIRSVDQFSSLAKGEETLTVIIALKAAPQRVKPASTQSSGWVNFNDYVEQAQRRFANEMGWQNFNDIVRLKTLPAMVKNVDKRELERILKTNSVAGVYEDFAVEPSLTHSNPMIGSFQTYHSSNNGRGQVVAVLDNGFDSSHPFLRGKIIAEGCFSLAGECPGGEKVVIAPGAAKPACETCNHGTHVAGIVGGSRLKLSNGEVIQGVAPDVKIVALKVLDANNGSVVPVLLALDWLYSLSQKMPLSAINLSLGSKEQAYEQQCDQVMPVFYELFQRFRQLGTAVFVASGNDSYSHAISAPACVSNAISVGAVGKQGAVAYYSNANKFLNVLAPGGMMKKSAEGGIVSSVPGGGFGYSQGTSMAAPHVAGAWALLKSDYPQASYAQLYEALISSAPKVRDNRNYLSYPVISTASAREVLSGQFGASPPESPPTARPPQQPTKPAPAPSSNCEKNIGGIIIFAEGC